MWCNGCIASANESHQVAVKGIPANHMSDRDLTIFIRLKEVQEFPEDFDGVVHPSICPSSVIYSFILTIFRIGCRFPSQLVDTLDGVDSSYRP